MPSSDGQKPTARDQEYRNPYTPRQMFWLKVIVYGLGVLIVISLIVVVIGFIRVGAKIGSRQAASTNSELAADPKATGGTGVEQPGEISRRVPASIVLPDNSEIVSVSTSARTIGIRFRADGDERIAIYDIESGALRREFVIRYGNP